MAMDEFFPPICVIIIVCLLLECLSLIRGDNALALSCRFIIVVLLYVAYVLKRDLVRRALSSLARHRVTRRRRRRQLLQFHNYVLFICCSASSIFHAMLLFLLLPFKPYCLYVLLVSLPVALDEYLDIEWLRERERAEKKEEEEAAAEETTTESENELIELRPSLYYTFYRTTIRAPLSLLYTRAQVQDVIDTSDSPV